MASPEPSKGWVVGLNWAPAGFEGFCGLGKLLSAGQGCGGGHWGEGHFLEIVKGMILYNFIEYRTINNEIMGESCSALSVSSGRLPCGAATQLPAPEGTTL